jgi:hypothetical protein
MTLREALLAEFDQEMANTRKSLERVPDDRLEWRPHPKSSSLGRLATHLAEIPAWGATTSLLMSSPPRARSRHSIDGQN